MNRRNLFQMLRAAAVPAAAATIVRAGSAVDPNKPGAKTDPNCLCTTPAHEGPRAKFFPNFVVIDQDGTKNRFYEDLVRGKIVLFNFFYADCEARCPLFTANLVKVQELLGDRVGRDVFMYSITLDPVHDRPHVLKEYMQMHGVKPGWTFLTGKPADLETLRKKLGFTDIDPAVDKDKAEHLGIIRYGNEKIDRWAACPAATRPEEIVKYLSWLDPKTPPQGLKAGNFRPIAASQKEQL
jgi:protein SCO1/2